jgi:hypothetical protein
MPTLVPPESDLGVSLRGDPLNILWLVPITSGEAALKLERGAGALYDLFDERDHPVAFSFANPRPAYR